MVSCKLEQVGGKLALVLDDTDCATLGLKAGDTVRLEPQGDGVLRIAETWAEDPHARGRAFLKRMNRRTSAHLV